MTLGEFRRETSDLPESTLIAVLDQSDVPLDAAWFDKGDLEKSDPLNETLNDKTIIITDGAR